MYRQDRPIKAEFPPDETLYRRCTLDEIDGDHLSPPSVHFKDYSVNRSQYSEPNDVLIPDWNAKIQDYTGWGIACFETGDIPPLLEPVGVNRYEFRMEHVPLDENYSHSEIRTFKNGTHNPKLSLGVNDKANLKKLRDKFSRKTRILRQPEVYAPAASGE